MSEEALEYLEKVFMAAFSTLTREQLDEIIFEPLLSYGGAS